MTAIRVALAALWLEVAVLQCAALAWLGQEPDLFWLLVVPFWATVAVVLANGMIRELAARRGDR